MKGKGKTYAASRPPGRNLLGNPKGGRKMMESRLLWRKSLGWRTLSVSDGRKASLKLQYGRRTRFHLLDRLGPPDRKEEKGKNGQTKSLKIEAAKTAEEGRNVTFTIHLRKRRVRKGGECVSATGKTCRSQRSDAAGADKPSTGLKEAMSGD